MGSHGDGNRRWVRGRRANVKTGGSPEEFAGPETRSLAFERTLFFSDAVFAIAITLLVIDLHLPSLPDHPNGEQVLTALTSVLPGVFAYALSFATIGLYWLAHLRRYREVERVDERVSGINLILLGFVAFIPFPTAMIGQHGDQPAIVAVYAVSLTLAGLMGTLTWLYLERRGLLRPALSQRFIRYTTYRTLSVPLVMMRH